MCGPGSSYATKKQTSLQVHGLWRAKLRYRPILFKNVHFYRQVWSFIKLLSQKFLKKRQTAARIMQFLEKLQLNAKDMEICLEKHSSMEDKSSKIKVHKLLNSSLFELMIHIVSDRLNVRMHIIHALIDAEKLSVCISHSKI